MKAMDVNGVLAQIRALNNTQAITPAPTASPAAEGGFGSLLKTAISEVNASQQEAGAQRAAFVAGQPDVDIAEVMLAVNRSSVSFKAMTEVRNRLVSAYQDIMNMPI